MIKSQNLSGNFWERWPSGLRRTLGKCVYPYRCRGFESHSLRHKLKIRFDIIKCLNAKLRVY